MNDSLLIVIFAAAFLVAASFFVHRRAAKKTDDLVRKQSLDINDLERKIHLRELDFLSEKNQAELEYANRLSQVRSAAFDEGKNQGRAQHELDIATRLAEQRDEFFARLQLEKERAATEARDRLRAEYELQTKLFNVTISPYIKVVKNKGMFSSDSEAKIGYQYQLLVNGIPAFKPHVVIQRHEKIREFDKAVKETLIAVAKGLAEVAVATYLGANPQFSKIGPEIIEQPNENVSTSE